MRSNKKEEEEEEKVCFELGFGEVWSSVTISKKGEERKEEKEEKRKEKKRKETNRCNDSSSHWESTE